MSRAEPLVISSVCSLLFAEKKLFSALSSDAQSGHLKLVTPPNNLTKAPLLNLESYTRPAGITFAFLAGWCQPLCVDTVSSRYGEDTTDRRCSERGSVRRWRQERCEWRKVTTRLAACGVQRIGGAAQKSLTLRAWLSTIHLSRSVPEVWVQPEH